MKLLDRFMHRWHIKIFSFLLALVLFWFYRISTLDERYFSVPLELDMNSAYIPAGDYPGHVTVTLRGASEEIFSVLEEDIRVYADFSDHEGEGSFRAPIQVKRTGSALAGGDVEIRIEPGDLIIRQEEKVSKTLPVDPSLTGFPSLGYELSQYFVSPSSLTVVGPRSEMENLESLSTEVIDLSGKYEDFTATSRLVYPSTLVYFPGGDVVEFRGVIEESLLVKTIANLDVSFLNLPSHLTVEGAIPRGSVTLQGNQAQIEELSREEIFLFADCSGIYGPGTYSLNLQPRVPGEAALLNWLPKEITLTVTGE
ncbi:MAG: CdaR family protein [Spirochaetales bacterium]|nr:CdaR family protein [Spirochaetales bacterium]